jgi:hypothetical protein
MVLGNVLFQNYVLEAYHAFKMVAITKNRHLFNMIQCNYLNLYVLEEDFEDTKGVIRIRKSTTQWPKGQTTIYKTYT